MTTGWVLRHLQSLDDWEDVDAYRVIFWAYAVCGLIKFALAISLSKKCEADRPEAQVQSDPETAPLLGENAVDGEAPKKPKKKSLISMLPAISPKSRLIVINLCLLFALDALASGLVNL